MCVRGQRHAPVPLPPGKTRYPLYRRLGGSQGRSGRVRKISPPSGFDPRTVQPAARRCTDCAVVGPGRWVPKSYRKRILPPAVSCLRMRHGVLSEHWYMSTRLYDVMPEISRDGVAAMVTRLRAGGSWLRIPVKSIDFSLPQSVQNRSRTQQDSYTKRTAHGSSLGEKRSGREFGHSHPSRAEITNEWSLTSAPFYRLQGAGGYNSTSWPQIGIAVCNAMQASDL